MEWPILAELSEPDRLSALQVCSRRRVARGDKVCREGERGDRLFLLERGHALVQAMTKRGVAGTFAILGPGDVFGEGALLSGTDQRNATVVAIEPLDVLYLTRLDFERLREVHPELNRFLFAVIATRMRNTTTQLLEALYSTAEQRVIDRLLDIAKLFRVAGGGTGRIPLTQEQIASLAGTTRPTANRVLREAEDAGALRLGRGYLVVRDVDVLRQLATEADERAD